MDKIDLFANATFELLVSTGDYTLLLFLDLVCLLYYMDSSIPQKKSHDYCVLSCVSETEIPQLAFFDEDQLNTNVL